MIHQSLYLWDLADTLFLESWNKAKSGFDNSNDYLKSLGFDLNTISDFDYEKAQEDLYIKELIKVNLTPGFWEMLEFGKNNAAFTTGTKEQIVCRAEQVKKNTGQDILPLFKEIISTFDFGSTNKKTEKMFEQITLDRTSKYQNFVYADNHLGNCQMFIDACKNLNKDFRCYHLPNGAVGLPQTADIYQADSLYAILKNERAILSLNS